MVMLQQQKQWYSCFRCFVIQTAQSSTLLFVYCAYVTTRYCPIFAYIITFACFDSNDISIPFFDIFICCPIPFPTVSLRKSGRKILMSSLYLFIFTSFSISLRVFKKAPFSFALDFFCNCAILILSEAFGGMCHGRYAKRETR